jgi:integrase/recombinase XerD
MTYRRCKCPMWYFGSIEGQRVRKALDTLSWERGEELLRELDPREVAVKVSLKEAGERFIADCKRRNHGKDTIGKYNLLVEELKKFFGQECEVSRVSLDGLSKYSETWKMSPLSSRKKIERLRRFFRFMVKRGWLKVSPAAELEGPVVKFKQRMPFTDAEIEKVLWATEIYSIKGIYGVETRARLRAFVKLLLFSGLRIRDAVTLDVSRFQGKEKLLVSTHKTGQPVVLPLPPDVATEIWKQQKEDCPFFFWSGNGGVKAAVGGWQRTLLKLFKLSGVHGHAHKFRTTMAVRLLTKGIPLEAVAAILGNSVKVCEKHYAPWVKSRQDVLEKAVKATWA